MTTFEKAIQFILPHEEEFARGHWGDENFVVSENVSGDAGGLTKYGIDAASHPGIDIANLTRARAVALYHQEWLFYRIGLLPDKIAIAQFDVRVNGGYAVKWLQRALNAQCSLTLTVDGIMGRMTITAANLCDQDAIVGFFLEERDDRYRSLVRANPNKKKFLSGWLQRDRDLRTFLTFASNFDRNG